MTLSSISADPRKSEKQPGQQRTLPSLCSAAFCSQWPTAYSNCWYQTIGPAIEKMREHRKDIVQLFTISRWMNSTASSCYFRILSHTIDEQENGLGFEIDITIQSQDEGVLSLIEEQISSRPNQPLFLLRRSSCLPKDSSRTRWIRWIRRPVASCVVRHCVHLAFDVTVWTTGDSTCTSPRNRSADLRITSRRHSLDSSVSYVEWDSCLSCEQSNDSFQVTTKPVVHRRVWEPWSDLRRFYRLRERI